jgi:glucose/arabinose dehydrogenase
MKTTLLWLLCLASGFSFSQTISLQQFTTGFNDPVEITHAGDTRLFVVQQSGQIRILNADGTINPTNFLNVSSLISTGSERGLLGLAFHPQYATNGYFYINYTNTAGNTVVARYTRSTANPNVADASSAQIVLTVNQPFSNHNGGCLRFGPDGYLYIGMGDGGSGGDPQNHAQNINSLLGKMLRIDVNNGSPYSNPSTNAFIGVDGADEIYATGLRNPWKFSFDRQTGDLWIADVGQGQIEEINKVAAGTAAGLNFGWRCYEGNQTYNATCTTTGPYTMPVAQYNHSNGACSITGGYVYRGTTYQNMQGKYFFADYCNNRIGYVGNTGGTVTFTNSFSGNFTTFGEDINGELYIAGVNSGIVYKITDTSAGITDLTANSFAVYPNPAKDVVLIRKSESGNYPVQAQIYDISGKLVLEKPLADIEENAVTTATLPSGFYMMNITDNSGNNFKQKLMIE